MKHGTRKNYIKHENIRRLYYELVDRLLFKFI